MTKENSVMNEQDVKVKYLKIFLEVGLMVVIGFLTIYPFILFLTNFLR